MLLKFLQISQENTGIRVFSIKLQAFRPATFLKRDSITSAFLWNLGNISENLFWRKSTNDCFWQKSSRNIKVSLEIKLHLFKMHCSLNLSFPFGWRRVNPMLVLGKADIITSFLPKLIQHLSILITSSVNFSVFNLSFIYLSFVPICKQNNIEKH